MTDTIEPALTAEEWRHWEREGIKEAVARACDSINYSLGQRPEKMGALCNVALPDSDPRKITRLHVNALYFAAEALREKGGTLLARGISPGIQNEQAKAVERLAEALASYLPPKET